MIVCVCVCVCVHEFNSLGPSIVSEIPFLARRTQRKRCNHVGPSPCYPQSQGVYMYQVLGYSSKGFSGKSIFFLFSHYHGNHFPDFFFCPCLKLGQNLSSCQVSDKSTPRFGQNDGANRQTDIQTKRSCRDVTIKFLQNKKLCRHVPHYSIT